MRIALIADSRAEHTRHWIRYFAEIGDDVLLLSTFPGPNVAGVRVQVLPGIFRAGDVHIKSSEVTIPSHRARLGRFMLHAGLANYIYPIWQQARILEVGPQAIVARKALQDFRPDVVHALRIQNEAYVGALASSHPLILSSWGSDFNFMARRYPMHRVFTRWVMRKPDAFIADCRRDIHLAHVYGLAPGKPTRCFPGNGGLDVEALCSEAIDACKRDRIVIYSRGVSPFVRLDTLLKAMQLLLARERGKLATCILLIPQALAPAVEQMRQKFGLSENRVVVQPSVSRGDLIRLLQMAAVSVSPSVTDGTPISMLEAMACGAFPVMSNLDSIREWITSGVNGLLFDPANAEELAACLHEALENKSMREAAQRINEQLIRERADYAKIMLEVRRFYQQMSGVDRFGD